MTRYLEQANECTDPVAGDFLWIYNASAGATDKDQKVDITRFGVKANTGTWTATQTFAPSAGSSGIALTTPTNQTVSMLALSAADCGAGYGPHISISRNSNASTPSAGWLQVVSRSNTAYSLWVDNSGNVRVGTSTPTNANDASGVVCGTQTSSLDRKNVIDEFTDYNSALNAIIDTPIYNFTYKSGAFNGERFTGIITDYSPIFGLDKDDEHPDGKSLNEVTAHGYEMAAIKALNKKIESQQSEILSLKTMIDELRSALNLHVLP